MHFTPKQREHINSVRRHMGAAPLISLLGYLSIIAAIILLATNVIAWPQFWTLSIVGVAAAVYGSYRFFHALRGTTDNRPPYSRHQTPDQQAKLARRAARASTSGMKE